MTDSEKRKLLSDCQDEIERAWNEERDDSPVHRLAAAHPTLAGELYDFFVCVVEADDDVGDGVGDEFGDDPPAAPTKTFLALVRDTAREFIDEIARSMDVPQDFLVDASEHGRILPPRARVELVRRAGRTRKIDAAAALASFDAPPSLRRAASREGAFAPSDDTYEDVVARSSLSDEAKRFWRDLA